MPSRIPATIALVALALLFFPVFQVMSQDTAPIMPLAPQALLLDITTAGERLVVAGEQGIVLYSDDQGGSWQQAKVPTTQMLTGIDFADELLGWAVGHDGLILVSEDGARSWRVQRDGLSIQHQTNLELRETAHRKIRKLEQALAVLIKYFRIRFAYMSLAFFVEDEDAVIQLEIHHDTEKLHRFNIEVVMATLMDVNYLLFGTQLLDGGRCLVDYPRPEDVERYQYLFGGKVTFSAGVNQLRFRKSFLGLPMSLSNPVARRVAEAQCEEEMRQMEASASVSDRVLRLLAFARPRGCGAANGGVATNASAAALRRGWRLSWSSGECATSAGPGAAVAPFGDEH